MYISGCDIVVLDDLEELFCTDVHNMYLAGVRAAGYYENKKHSEEIGIPIDRYVNAGVLIINIQKIIADNKGSELIGLIQNNYSSQDQDILNIVCHDNICILDFKWNVMTPHLQICNGHVCVKDNRGAVHRLLDYYHYNVSIIHYADKEKPWYFNCIYSSIWREFNENLLSYYCSNVSSLVFDFMECKEIK